MWLPMRQQQQTVVLLQQRKLTTMKWFLATGSITCIWRCALPCCLSFSSSTLLHSEYLVGVTVICFNSIVSGVIIAALAMWAFGRRRGAPQAAAVVPQPVSVILLFCLFVF
jgi:hypothetical protein